MKSVIDSLRIPVKSSRIPLFVKGTTQKVADRYNRVVIGERGPYVEFTQTQIIDSELYIPRGQLYRLTDPRIYYVEFRTRITDVKVYYQMRTVAYADYHLCHFYISPYDLCCEDGSLCIVSPDTDYNPSTETFFDFE